MGFSTTMNWREQDEMIRITGRIAKKKIIPATAGSKWFFFIRDKLLMIYKSIISHIMHHILFGCFIKYNKVVVAFTRAWVSDK